MITEKQPIAETLKNMRVGQTAKFAHIQYDGINKGINRMQTKFKADGLRYSTRTTDEAIEVTRVA